MPPISSQQLANLRESHDFWLPRVRLPDVHLWALIGSESGETSFLTHPVGDRGQAHGAAQWHKGRADVIRTATGIDVVTAPHADQLRAMFWEMTNAVGYRHVWDQLMATETVVDAVTVLVVKYEQSAQQARDVARRTQLAEQLRQSYPQLIK
jgi:hypothetical protein